MAVRQQTHNKLRHLRQLVFWMAQGQLLIMEDGSERWGLCPECLEPLVDGTWGSADDLTVEHTSGSYNHRERQEGGAEPKPTILMHKSCHKRMTLTNRWRHVYAGGHWRLEHVNDK